MGKPYDFSRLPFTLQSNHVATFIFVAFASLGFFASWFSVFVVITHAHRAKDFLLLIPAVPVALIAPLLVYACINILRHPNTLTVTDQGVEMVRAKRRTFVAWQDMDRVVSGGGMIWFPDTVSVLLKPDAALRRQRDTKSYAASMTVGLGNCWQTDRWYNGSQIAKALEAWRITFTRQPQRL